MRRSLVAWFVATLLASPAAGQRLKVSVSISSLEQAARRDSNDAAARYSLALGYWSKEKWDSADSTLKTALAIDPRFAAAYLALAYLPQANGRFWKERVILLGNGRAWYIYEASDSVRLAFDRLYRRAFMIDPLVDIRIQVAAEYRGGHVDGFDRALYAYNDSKWEEAYQRFGELVADSSAYHGEHAPRYEQVLWYYALAAARLQKPEESIRSLEGLIHRSETREASDSLFRWPLRTHEYRYVLAYMRQRAGDAPGAVREYQEALTGDLGLYMAHVRIGDIYEALARWDEAVLARRNAINANPDDPSLVLDLGKTLANAGRWAEAEPALREAATANPRDSRSQFYLGLALEHLDRKDEARAALTRFISLAPSRYDRQIAMAKQHLAALQ